MKKQLFSLVVVSTLSLSALLSPMMVNRASAEDLSKLQQDKEKINQEQSSINTKIKEKESKIDELKSQQNNVNSEIKRLDLAVEDATTKLEEKNVQISQTQEEIKALEVEIVELKERIEKRNELLKERAASFQEGGGTIDYLDVLFGAQSFSDFIDRVGAVATLVQADKDILDQHQKDKTDLETKQAEVKTKLADLEKMKKELEALKSTLDRQREEKAELMNSLKREEEEMHADMIAAEEENAVLAAQAAAIQKAISLEQARQAEVERQKAAAAAASASTQQSSGGNSNSVQAASSPPLSSGSFTWPAPGYVSSGYGGRSLGNHFGIDIAKAGPNVPITAAADGVVIRSYYSTSYGNAIFVSHSINGQVYTTVYAHMSSRAVGSGAVVKKGQRIGTMGNTGQSFGQHLHFELHKGEWNITKSNSVNPLSYLP